MQKLANLLGRVFLCVAIAHLSKVEVGAQVIPEATKVQVRLEQPLSSATAELGQPVQLAVSDDVVIDGVVVIARDSVVNGTIVQAQPKRRMGRTGKLDFSIDNILLSDGKRLAVRYSLIKKDGGSKAVSTGIITAGVAVLFFPAAPFVLFRKGKDTTYNKGMKFEVFTDAAYTLKPESTGLAAIPTSDEPALTNEDVIALKGAGFSDESILAKIDVTPGAYKLDTQSLIKLKEAGLSEEVITALSNPRTAQPPIAQPPIAQAPVLSCSLVPTEKHGPRDTEFVIQTAARDSVDGALTPLIELSAFDPMGDETLIAHLDDSDKIRLRTDKKKVKVKLPKKDKLVDGKFHVWAEAARFELSCRATNSRGVPAEEEVQID